ncbi:hypothetical protein IIB79_05805 [candidate division KSB1 bacterium]|nr:hypothetical protein [candidate division KSB1 bacterium]
MRKIIEDESVKYSIMIRMVGAPMRSLAKNLDVMSNGYFPVTTGNDLNLNNYSFFSILVHNSLIFQYSILNLIFPKNIRIFSSKRSILHQFNG